MHETTTKQPLALDWAHIAFIVALIVIFLVVTCFGFRLKKYCTCVRPPAAPHLGYNGPAVGDADDGYIDPAALKSLRDNHGVCGTSQAGHGPIKGGPFSKQPMPAPRSQITSEDDHKIHYENITPAPRQSKQSLYHIEMIKDKAPKPSTPMQHRGSNSQSPVKGNLAGGYTQAVSTESTVQIAVEDGVEYYSDFDYGKTREEGKPKLPSRRPIPSAPLGSDTSEDDSPQPVEGVGYYSDHDRENIREQEFKPKPPIRNAHQPEHREHPSAIQQAQPEHREHPSVIQQAVRGDGDGTVSDADDEYVNICPNTKSVIGGDS